MIYRADIAVLSGIPSYLDNNSVNFEKEFLQINSTILISSYLLGRVTGIIITHDHLGLRVWEH